MVKFVISMTRAQKRLILLLLDLAFVPLAFLAAFVIHFSAAVPVGTLLLNWPVIPLLIVVALALSVSLGTANIRLKHYDMAAAQQTALFAALLAMSSFGLAELGKLPIPSGFHVVFGLVYFALSASSRIVLLQILLAIYSESAAISRVLIYGAGRTGMSLVASLRGRSDIVPVAFIDDNATLRDLVVAGLPVYSGIHIERLLSQYRIDRVILAMPSLSVQKQTFLSRRLEKLGLDVQTIPAFSQLIGENELVDKLLPVRPGEFLGREQLREDFLSDNSNYAGRVVLITGAGGSIGLELCRQMISQGPRRLVLLEQSELALYNAEMEFRVLAEGTGIEIVAVLGSVANGKLVSRTILDQQVDCIFHAAAYKHVPMVEANALVGLYNNVFGTAVVAQKAREHGIDRFVLISTDKAVRPRSIMGASKRMAEMIVQDYATRSPRTVFSIVRFGNVLGSSGSVLPLFQEQISCGGPVTLTDEAVTRYFMTIEEAAFLVLLAGSFAEGGEVFVLDMGDPVSVADLARQLIRASGYTVRDVENPDGDIEIVTTGLRPGEKIREELMVRKGAQTTAHPKIICVREDHLSELETAAALRDLSEAIEADDVVLAQATLRRWIAEYSGLGTATAEEAQGIGQRAH
ncbi:MAG: polysaccharide biosynthesis protein [Rhodobacteraceae bacterium]|nr:polysaccharide biosynthesis protein [Paracoccaceae bacterium]